VLDALAGLFDSGGRGRNRKSKNKPFVCSVGYLSLLSRRFLSAIKPKSGKALGGKGGENGIQLTIVQQGSTQLPKLDHSLPVREWRKTCEVALQLRHDDFHMRFIVGAWKYLRKDVVRCDGESVRCCRSNTSARDGDTVVVPATRSLPGGAANWTSRINVTVGITIKGQTTITGAGTSTPSITDNTVILDNSPRNTPQSGLFQFSLTPTQQCRITGFTFRPGASNIPNQNGVVQLTSTGTAANYTMRVDNCHFDHVRSRCVYVTGWCMGVADHNVVHAEGNSP
jgi:hypothetical protein